eukprot:2621726-Heterocapsa_arctica.AAC.1
MQPRPLIHASRDEDAVAPMQQSNWRDDIGPGSRLWGEPRGLAAAAAAGLEGAGGSLCLTVPEEELLILEEASMLW